MYSIISVGRQTDKAWVIDDDGVRVRKAGLSDLPDLILLEGEAFGARRWEQAFMREMMCREGVQTLLVEGGAVLAYVMFSVSRPFETVEVLSLAVSPSLRRRGLAKDLMARVESLAAEEARTVALCVRPDNDGAVNLYVSLGYKVLALCPGYYEDGGDAYMMVKHLE